jgi:topoisomerase IV subunit B
VFIREPEFVGQTKDRLATAEAARLVEGAVRDHFDHWLAADTKAAGALLDYLVLRAEERLRRRAEKETARKTATRKLRLPGKLVDCSARRATARSSSSSRATAPAARPRWRATARPRRCCRSGARS